MDEKNKNQEETQEPYGVSEKELARLENSPLREFLREFKNPSELNE